MIKKLIEQTIKDVLGHNLTVLEEYKFNEERKWRFDFAIMNLKIAIEINGAVWEYGRHNRASGYLKDLEKLNNAQIMGWRVLQYTPQQLSELIRDLKIILKELK